jgi:hypothetical protein
MLSNFVAIIKACLLTTMQKKRKRSSANLGFFSCLCLPKGKKKDKGHLRMVEIKSGWLLMPQIKSSRLWMAEIKSGHPQMASFWMLCFVDG